MDIYEHCCRDDNSWETHTAVKKQITRPPEDKALFFEKEPS
jgi:hypothetical protein